MKRLVFAPAANEDLLTIGAYIAEDNPDRAESFVAELEATALRIAERLRSFPSRDEISDGLGVAVHGRYLLLFRELEADVRIVRVVHGARDLRAIFST